MIVMIAQLKGNEKTFVVEMGLEVIKGMDQVH